MIKTNNLYSMKETCNKTGLTYDALKFYCNEGLIPNVKRNKSMIMTSIGLRAYLA